MKVIYSDILDKTLDNVIGDYFPELSGNDIKICFTFTDKDYGAAKASNLIILLLPDIEIDFTGSGIKLLIAHELCHFINLGNPQIEFKKRMPKAYCKVWNKLELEGELSCDRGKGNSKIISRTN